MEDLLKFWAPLVTIVGLAASWGDNRRLMKSHREQTKDGFEGVNGRLDTINGKVYNHEGRISKLEG